MKFKETPGKLIRGVDANTLNENTAKEEGELQKKVDINAVELQSVAFEDCMNAPVDLEWTGRVIEMLENPTESNRKNMTELSDEDFFSDNLERIMRELKYLLLQPKEKRLPIIKRLKKIKDLGELARPSGWSSYEEWERRQESIEKDIESMEEEFNHLEEEYLGQQKEKELRSPEKRVRIFCIKKEWSGRGKKSQKGYFKIDNGVHFVSGDRINPETAERMIQKALSRNLSRYNEGSGNLNYALHEVVDREYEEVSKSLE